jgi:Icc-related predicted phosphoesterase
MIEVEGLKIYGTPWQPYFCNWAFNIYESDRLISLYQNIPEDLDILITHCPPYNILDKTHITPAYYDNTVNCGEEPLGSKELETVLSELGEHRPKIHCFGHIHGDGGNIVGLPYLTKPYPGGVCYINASVCDENYNPINKIVTIDYE